MLRGVRSDAFLTKKKLEVCIQHRLAARRLRSIIPSTIFTKRLEHQGRLSSTFVPPSRSFTPPFRIVTSNNELWSAMCHQ